LNKRFFTFNTKNRPYIILKWAESSDGFIAPIAKEKQEPAWITNSFSRQLVHKWRSEEQAILVGTQTVLDDNPKLDTRNWSGNNPTRIIFDRTGKISEDYHVKDQKIKTIVITEKENLQSTQNLIYENCIFDIRLVFSVCEILYKHNIQSVIIEGGRQTIQTFIDAAIWDEARIFKGQKSLEKGIEAPVIAYKNIEKQAIEGDELIKIFNHD
jgi:diaminohydroxyphosphoribosylaminopyrimidine deaminase/5-amino-6-(5-phosphoribosylamino)uracil reductase